MCNYISEYLNDKGGKLADTLACQTKCFAVFPLAVHSEFKFRFGLHLFGVDKRDSCSTEIGLINFQLPQNV